MNSFSTKSYIKEPKEESIDDEEDEDVDEEIVTPYSICNQTNVDLLVKRMNY